MESSNAKQTLLWLWIIAAILIIMCLLFWGQGYASDDTFYNDLNENERNFILDMEEQYLNADNIKPLRFRDDTRVNRDELIKGSIEVIKGTLVLEGEVEGTVLVIFGDIELEPTALVRGDVISVEGVIWTKSGAQVDGDIIETGDSYKKRYQEYQSTHERRSYIEKRSDRYEDQRYRRDRSGFGYFRKETDREPVYASYNRVDGFTVGLQFPGAGWWERNHHQFAILGKGGYSFASKKSQYQIGLEKWLFIDSRFALGVEYHDMTDTEDRWLLSEMENSLAAGLVKEDFYDFYNRKGYSAYFSQYINRYLFIKAEYRDDDFSNLVNTTEWAVFGKNKEFRANPGALPQGLVDQQLAEVTVPGVEIEPYLNLKSVAGTVQFDTRDRDKNPGQGWLIEAFGERVGMDEECDMQFERYILDIRRYQPLGWDENLNIRLRGGTARGDMPPMYWFDLGGISTLHGYKYKEFTGDRMVLANIEYRLGTSSSDWFFLDDFDVVLFMDSGYAWFSDVETPERVNAWSQEEPETDPLDNDPKDSFESLTWKSMKTNFGVALASSDDDFRINFARRTDIGGKDFIVTFRLQRAF
ncbi:MAG TPA: BamA/TamA family outer membrane protein [bacterium]|nr:BamA/TamA family outer membrane protein [bacterium]HPN45922.1 BamA/TamA family outer membrane protein [bacterium]